MRTLKTGTSNSGFTLLELLVVICILSLLVVLSYPSFSMRSDGLIKSETARVASILRSLHDSALSTKNTHVLHLDCAKKMIRYKGTEGEREETIQHLHSVVLHSKGVLTEEEVTLFFHPTGVKENFIIYLRDGNSLVEVVFNALSGRVKVVAHETS